jgi:hypothetical protein
MAIIVAHGNKSGSKSTSKNRVEVEFDARSEAAWVAAGSWIAASLRASRWRSLDATVTRRVTPIAIAADPAQARNRGGEEARLRQ